MREALVQLRHRVALALNVNGARVRNNGGGGFWFAGSAGSASELCRLSLKGERRESLKQRWRGFVFFGKRWFSFETVSP